MSSCRPLAATACRCLCRVWLKCDRVYPALEGLIKGCDFQAAYVSGATPRGVPLVYRQALAEGLREVCVRESERGKGLLAQVQACLEAREEVLAALGLECVTALCEGDAIGMCLKVEGWMSGLYSLASPTLLG